jgi:putative FmdB family regulatory protein
VPIFKYRCRKCDNVFEYLKLSKDDECDECDPDEGGCGSPEIEPVLTTAAFSLQGGGWYKDGYSSTATEADRGSKESKIRSMAKEQYEDMKTAEDKAHAEIGFKRIGTQRLESFPDDPVE